jgi:CHAT domain-containing protein
MRPDRSAAGCRAWRAFLFAGAKALLVSNWYVATDEAAPVDGIHIRHLRPRPVNGRAEALRRAMIKVLDRAPTTERTHPLFWESFVVVRDGGPSRGRPRWGE